MYTNADAQFDHEAVCGSLRARLTKLDAGNDAAFALAVEIRDMLKEVEAEKSPAGAGADAATPRAAVTKAREFLAATADQFAAARRRISPPATPGPDQVVKL